MLFIEYGDANAMLFFPDYIKWIQYKLLIGNQTK